MFMADETLRMVGRQRIAWDQFVSLDNLFTVLGLDPIPTPATDGHFNATHSSLSDSPPSAAAPSGSYAGLHCDSAWRSALHELKASAQVLFDKASSDNRFGSVELCLRTSTSHRPRHDAHSIFRGTLCDKI